MYMIYYAFYTKIKYSGVYINFKDIIIITIIIRTMRYFYKNTTV